MTNSQKQIAIACCLALALVVGATAVYKLSQKTQQTHIDVPQVATSTVKVSPVSGKLLLSLIPESVGEGALPLAYTYDLSAHVLVPTYRGVEEIDRVLPYHVSLSPDRKILTTLYLQSSFTEGALDPSTRLMSMPFGGNLFTQILHESRDSARFGTGKDAIGLAPRLPAVNNKGDVVFGVFPKNLTEKKVSFDWDIRYTSKTAESVLAKGLFPHWISDTRMVYLAKDGIHQYDFVKLEDALVAKLKGRDGKEVKPAPNMMLNVSRDGQMVVVTNPEDMLVTIYRFNSDGSLTEYKHVDAYAFWPVFSPDGKTLALQTLLLADMSSKGKTHPRIVFYDISKDAPSVLDEVVNLDGFIHSAMFFTDWY